MWKLTFNNLVGYDFNKLNENTLLDYCILWNITNYQLSKYLIIGTILIIFILSMWMLTIGYNIESKSWVENVHILKHNFLIPSNTLNLKHQKNPIKMVPYFVALHAWRLFKSNVLM